MAIKTKVANTSIERGEHMKMGKGWRLVSPGGKAFNAALHGKMKIGGERIVVFRVSVPKG